MHPLKENLSLLTNTQIEDKISKLSAMYFMAQNPDVRHQIILLLDSYKIEPPSLLILLTVFLNSRK
jgi:hypothetical protein